MFIRDGALTHSTHLDVGAVHCDRTCCYVVSRQGLCCAGRLICPFGQYINLAVLKRNLEQRVSPGAPIARTRSAARTKDLLCLMLVVVCSGHGGGGGEGGSEGSCEGGPESGGGRKGCWPWCNYH